MSATCHECKRELAEGESAWAEDFKTIDVSGRSAAFKLVTRYTCDNCADEAIA